MFSVLSSAQLTPKEGTSDDIQNLIPQYVDSIPSQAYRYNAAVLHMKKDNQELEEDIAEFQRRVTEYNTSHIELQLMVKSIIEQRINQAGYCKEQDERFMHMYQYINTYLRQIKAAKDMRQHAIHIVSTEKKGIGTEDFVNTIHEIIQDETILGHLGEVEPHESNLKSLASINRKSMAISMAISEEDYDTEADCCPTYLTLVKRLL